MTQSFAEKLRLVMGLLSIDRETLGRRVGVDKSVISRWLNGTVTPSSHNLARLSELIAERAPGFNVVDWQRDMAGLAAWLGEDGEPPPARADGPAPGLILNIIDQAVQTTALRGQAYEGFWRTLRPADSGGFAYDYVYVRRAPNGLLATSMGSLGSVAEGWLLLLHNQLFMFVADTNSGGITYSVMNGLGASKVVALDGVGVGASHDPGRTPTALPVFTERIGDLSGDEAADQAFFAELNRTATVPTDADVSDELMAHIIRDFGPAASARGGDWVLQVSRSRSLSRAASASEQIAGGPANAAAAAQPRPSGVLWEGGDPAAAPFSEKLSLVLKLLNLSSAQVASALAVHKSVVSRWLNGASVPASHNLTRLTAMVAERSPGFSMLDWDRTPGALMVRFGVDPQQIVSSWTTAPVLTLPTWDQIMSTAALRGAAYEGFFRLLRPCALHPDLLVEEYAQVSPDPAGLPRFRLAAEGTMMEGWLLTVHDQIHVIAADKIGGALVFGIFNGIGAARVGAVDGIIIGPALDVARSLTAMPAYGEFVEPLSGDAEKDERRFLELAASIRRIEAKQLNNPVAARILRDCGPVAAGKGGAMVLQMPLQGCLTRARAKP